MTLTPDSGFSARPRKAALGLAVGWGLGFLLAAPYILPVLEYTHTGARMARRSAGEEERPPVGLAGPAADGFAVYVWDHGRRAASASIARAE